MFNSLRPGRGTRTPESRVFSEVSDRERDRRPRWHRGPSPSARMALLLSRPQGR